jgi:pSer/pThr/pTyr-binding forkhead associated (FHA) protein
MVGVTRLQDMSLKSAPLGQPVLNPDGSLLLPEASSPVPAAVVAKFQEQPALIVLPGNADQEKGRPPLVYMLRPGKHTRLGRDKANDIDLADMAVSRRHSEIFPGPDGFYIRDGQSSNGVIVNQMKIDNPYRLSHGDRIVLGSSLIYFIDLHATSQLVRPVPGANPAGVQTLKVGSATVGLLKKVDSPPVEQGQNNLRFCQHCGVANTRNARFCAGCSSPLT